MNAAGMANGQLAAAIGLKESAIDILLSRGARPQMKTVQKIADVLGVPVEDIWPT
jgi:DNA-binding XRE family transcriptional regulator